MGFDEIELYSFLDTLADLHVGDGERFDRTNRLLISQGIASLRRKLAGHILM